MDGSSYLQGKREELKQQLADAQVFMEAEQDDAAGSAIISARQTLDEILYTQATGSPPRDFSQVLEWRRKKMLRGFTPGS